MSQINIKHITSLNSESLKGLEFFEQELGFLQGRLNEIAADYTGKEVSEKIEHFQNQFVIHSNAIDELKHLIHSNKKNMEAQLLKSDVFVDVDTTDEHQKLNEQYLTEEKMFNELHHEFNHFAAEWM